MKAEVTAENRPACDPAQYMRARKPPGELTNISVVFSSSSFLFVNSLSYPWATFR